MPWGKVLPIGIVADGGTGTVAQAASAKSISNFFIPCFCAVKLGFGKVAKCAFESLICICRLKILRRSQTLGEISGGPIK